MVLTFVTFALFSSMVQDSDRNSEHIPSEDELSVLQDRSDEEGEDLLENMEA